MIAKYTSLAEWDPDLKGRWIIVFYSHKLNTRIIKKQRYFISEESWYDAFRNEWLLRETSLNVD